MPSKQCVSNLIFLQVCILVVPCCFVINCGGESTSTSTAVSGVAIVNTVEYRYLTIINTDGHSQSANVVDSDNGLKHPPVIVYTIADFGSNLPKISITTDSHGRNTYLWHYDSESGLLENNTVNYLFTHRIQDSSVLPSTDAANIVKLMRIGIVRVVVNSSFNARLEHSSANVELLGFGVDQLLVVAEEVISCIFERYSNQTH